jgi:hypothetical protein
MAIAEKELVVRRGAAAPAKPNRYGLTTVTGADLGVNVTGPVAEAPADIQEGIKDWSDRYLSSALHNTEQYLDRLEAQLSGKTQTGGTANLGEQTSLTGPFPYVAYDIVSIAPIQFVPGLFGPPFLPNRIVASGELMLLNALMFINPISCAPCGFLNPATVQCGTRVFRITMDLLNITTGAPLPSIVLQGVYPAVAPTLQLFQALVAAPPVPRTQLIELNVTAEIVTAAQPFAAFATWHVDTDDEFPWFGSPISPPARAAQLEHDIPVRFMVYPL